MSYAYFDDPISCPECGHSTQELCEVESGDGKVLMCEGCYKDSQEWFLNPVGDFLL